MVAPWWNEGEGFPGSKRCFGESWKREGSVSGVFDEDEEWWKEDQGEGR